MWTIFRKTLQVLVAAGAFGAPAFAAEDAASFPSKPVRMLVGFAAGGASDMIARIVAEKLSQKWGQPVVVENRTGASGIIAGGVLSKSPKNGYVIGLQSVTQTILPALGEQIPYDIVSDFTPLARGANISQILVVGSSARMANVRSLPELVKLAQSMPRQLTYSSGGAGTTPQLSSEILSSLAKMEVLHVAYKGGNPAVLDVVSGQVDYTLANAPEVLSLVTGGKLRPIAVTSAKRLALLPGVPAISEFIPGFNVVQWFGFFAPAGIPQPIAAKINADMVEVLNSADVKARFEAMGIEPAPTSSQEFAAIIKKDLGSWSDVVQSLKLKIAR